MPIHRRYLPSANHLSLALATAALLAGLVQAPAQAQAFPSRPLLMIVGYAAGTGADGPARIIADGMSENLHQPVVVENRPGGNAQISLNALRTSEPDGHTILWGGAAPLAVQPIMDTKVSGLEKNFNPLDQFSIVAFAGTYDSVLVTGPNGPKTMQELAAMTHAAGSNVSYGTFSAGSTFDMAPEYFFYLTKSKATGVRYKTSNIPDVMSGLLTVTMQTLSSGTANQVTAGKLHAIAVLMKTRSPKLPNVPTMTEAGFPEMNEIDWDPWFGVFVRKGVPQAAINRLNEATRVVLSNPKTVTRLDAGAFTVYTPTDAREAQARWEHNFVTTRTLLGKLNLLPK